MASLGNKLSVEDANLAGRRVLLRAGFNVPCDAHGRILDRYRLDAGAATIKYVFEHGARSVAIVSHIGRPAGRRREELSLRVLVPVLEELLERRVQFVDDCLCEEAFAATAAPSQGAVVLLESARFYLEEENAQGFNKERADDAAIELFGRQLARHGDVYINDAFDLAHRAFTSLTTIPMKPKYMGLLLQRELKTLARLLQAPARPFLCIFGGAKGSEKTLMVDNILDYCDELIIGGGMAFTFLKVLHNMDIGASMYDEANIQPIRDIFAKAKVKNIKMHLPTDFIVAESTDSEAQISTASLAEGIRAPKRGLDIGEDSRAAFASVISRAASIAWNGPAGVFESAPFAGGTRALIKAVGAATARGAFTVAGGGDTTAALVRFDALDSLQHVCTGGGAMLAALGGRALPAVDALADCP